jgi:hypothetical protein
MMPRRDCDEACSGVPTSKTGQAGRLDKVQFGLDNRTAPMGLSFRETRMFLAAARQPVCRSGGSLRSQIPLKHNLASIKAFRTEL